MEILSLSEFWKIKKTNSLSMNVKQKTWICLTLYTQKVSGKNQDENYGLNAYKAI